MNTLPSDSRDKSVKDKQVAALLRLYFATPQFVSDTHTQCQRREEQLAAACADLDRDLAASLDREREANDQCGALVRALERAERRAGDWQSLALGALGVLGTTLVWALLR